MPNSEGVTRQPPKSGGFISPSTFKAVNDTYGHQIGDDLLRQVADNVRHVLRESDTLVRFGGDEFLLILPDTDAISATCLVERLVHAAHALNANGNALQYTLSAGVAQLESGESAHTLVGRADKALYAEKHQRHARAEAPGVLGVFT